jgi:mannose-6-phosphate isomerase-like protein (cupin superfamily)
LHPVVAMSELPPLEVPSGPIPGRFLLEGSRFGLGQLTLVMGETAPGNAVPLHRHDYEEIFIIHGGRGTYVVGNAIVEAGPGEVVLIPSGVPHKFTNYGTETLYHTAVHATGTFVMEVLEPQ